MVTTRTPIARELKTHRITPEAIELFGRGFDIQVAGADKTWEAEGGRRREFLDTINALNATFGLLPSERGPLECHDGLPPRWVVQAAEADGFDGWKQAVETRRKLVAALIERRGLTKALKAETEKMYREVTAWKGRGGDYPSGMLTKGQDVQNWMERLLHIPEGKFVGQPLELLDFQREIIRGIYDNDCKKRDKGAERPEAVGGEE
jgi:hypothetical protein